MVSAVCEDVISYETVKVPCSGHLLPGLPAHCLLHLLMMKRSNSPLISQVNFTLNDLTSFAVSWLLWDTSAMYPTVVVITSVLVCVLV